jgi:hypothetical protein
MNPLTQIARMRDLALAKDTWFKEVRDADLKLVEKQANIINALLEFRPSDPPKPEEVAP